MSIRSKNVAVQSINRWGNVTVGKHPNNNSKKSFFQGDHTLCFSNLKY